MSTIDEIMGAIGRHGDDCIRDADAASESFEALRELIAAALADAERRGAEAMREAADQLRADADEIFPPSDRGRQAPVEVRDVVEWYSESIRALPLPIAAISPPGSGVALLVAHIDDQAAEIERLKAAQSMMPASAAHGEIALRWRVQADGRYAVDMLVSNLDTEAQAHAAVAYVQSLFAGDEMTGRH